MEIEEYLTQHRHINRREAPLGLTTDQQAEQDAHEAALLKAIYWGGPIYRSDS